MYKATLAVNGTDQDFDLPDDFVFSIWHESQSLHKGEHIVLRSGVLKNVTVMFNNSKVVEVESI